MTLTTGVMMLNIHCYIAGINYFLKYIQIESSYFKVKIFHNSTAFAVFWIK